MKRKLLSVLLTFCLAFSLLPTAALAEEPADPVAQIGEKTYATLKAAFEEAKDGDTVTLLGNVTELETISITGGKKVDLNLNEKNITFKADNYFLVDNGALNVTGKGNITSSHGNDNNTWLPTIYAYGTDTDTANYSVVTVGKDVVIDNRGSYGLAIGHKDYKAYGAKVIVEGTVKSTYGFTVTGNAKATQGNIPEITVTESGKIVSTDGSAIYAAGYGIYTIAGTLSGTEFGIEIRAGKLNVEDTAKISATGNFSDPVPNGNGSTVTGAAIAVSQHTTNLPIDVNIKGGEISETGTNGHALYEIDTVRNEEAGNVAKDVSITVSGGSFNGNVYSTNNKLSITGGAFTDIANAVKYAADNATIKLADNVNVSSTISVGKSLIVDLNGRNIHGQNGESGCRVFQVIGGGNLTLTGTGTISTVAKNDDNFVDTSSVIRVGDNETTKSAELTVGSGVTISAPVSYGISVFGKNTSEKLTVSGKVHSETAAAIAGNGSSNMCATEITIEDGAEISSTGDAAIYHPQAGKLTVNNATITGKTGIECKSGDTTIAVQGAVVTATDSVSHTKNNNGTSTRGYAIAVVENAAYKGGAKATISDGKYTGPVAIVKDDESVENPSTLTITGGLFSSDPSTYVADSHYVDASNNGDYPYTVKVGTKPAGALIVVKDATAASVSDSVSEADKSAVETAVSSGKTSVDGVAEAVSASKAALVSSANITPAATDKVEVEVKVNVTVTAANLSAGTLTFEAKPTATITVTRSDNTTEKKENVSVPNSLLSGEITVKLPLPTVDGKLFTPKQIKHTSSDGSVEYFLDTQKTGAKTFEIKDGCAVFTITKFSTFELSGTVTYVEPSYSSGSSSSDPTYSVSTPSKTEHGTVTVSPKNASKGDTVTVTVKPDSGYVLETLTVTDKNGNELTLKDKGNGKYTFTMPAGKVEVKATFMEDNSMLNFFYDVPNNAYFYEAVKWAVKNGITDGVGNNLFAPEQPCTRAQIVTFLWRAAGSPEPKGAASGMTDVVSGSYYEKAVAWAIENGITTGTTTSTFSPDATCTRAQAVTFLARALKAKAASAAEFSDVPTGSYFADAVAWAAANGVTEGIGGGLFGSDNDCTRGQIVTFLYRAYNK